MSRLPALASCLFVSAAAAAPDPGKNPPRLLDLEPAAAPVPALKYQLLPEVAEMNPGNAVPAYLKCWAEQNNFFFAKQSVDERERLLKCPLSDIKPGSLKGYGGSATRQADFAARLEYADWNLLPQMREQGYNLLLPEVQQMRMLAGALVVRGRGQIVDKDYDGAVGTLKTLFALSRHLGEHPTIITGLVAVAIAQMSCNLAEELVQQPGAPNLYWAFTGLPTPLVDMRKAASADRVIYRYGFGWMADRDRVWTADDMGAVHQKVREFAALGELTPEERQAADQWRLARARDADWLAAARKGLCAGGFPEGAVAKYPPEQVIFHYLMEKSRVYHDEAMKWLPVPFHQSEAALAELSRPAAEIEQRLTRLTVVFRFQVRAAHVRLEQRLALLRIAEAIRLDAAANGGTLPATLGDLSVPIPIDPVSGKAFEYKVDGITALLSGKEAAPGAGRFDPRYEIRLRK